MQPSPVETFEWHIFENAKRALPSAMPGIHMGPFASEQECRAVLASLSQLPGFDHRCLEVRQQPRRREKRMRIKLPIRLYRVDAPYQDWAAHTIDISGYGARFSDPSLSLTLGEFIVIRYAEREGVFRVVWIGLPGQSSAGQIGVKCLNPEVNLWDLDLSDHVDDEPLHHEIAVAQAVQRKLFPRDKPPLRTLEYCGKCIQAHTVGGDYYDFLEMGSGRVGFVMADVAGKGIAAALLMANLQGSIHNRPDINIADISGLLSTLNLHLYKHTEAQRYATLFFGCYNDESRTFAYVNCGHPPALLVRECGRVERLEATATVLGLFGNWECSVQQIHIYQGDVLSVFTDGITETTSSAGDEFGEKGLLKVLQNGRGQSPSEVLERVEQALQRFRRSDQAEDDVTLVIARAL